MTTKSRAGYDGPGRTVVVRSPYIDDLIQGARWGVRQSSKQYFPKMTPIFRPIRCRCGNAVSLLLDSVSYTAGEQAGDMGWGSMPVHRPWFSRARPTPPNRRRASCLR